MLLFMLSALALATPPITDVALNAVVTITADLPGDELDHAIILGSGSYIRSPTSQTGYGILTADHVAVYADVTGLNACFRDNTCIPLPSSYSHGVTNAVTAQGDWAMFAVPKQPRQALRLASRDAILGDEVVMIGYPGTQFRVSYGYLAAPTSDDVMFLELSNLKGESGSPVMNKAGRVLCEVVAYGNVSLDEGDYYPVFNRTYCTVPEL